MKIEEIINSIFNVQFDSPTDLGMTFVRPQEYYESAEFRNKIFTLDEFKEHWIKNTKPGKETGNFIYPVYWDGFNIPSTALDPFYKGKFDPLSDREKMLLEAFEKKNNFYLIGTRAGSKPETLKHEIGHGLYFTDKEYKKAVQAIMARLDLDSRNKLNKFLIEQGYHSAVFADERHAYTLAGGEDLKETNVNLKLVEPIHNKLNQVYNQTYARKRKL